VERNEASGGMSRIFPYRMKGEEKNERERRSQKAGKNRGGAKRKGHGKRRIADKTHTSPLNIGRV